jgi:recombinational DNA repair ATPase RecF
MLNKLVLNGVGPAQRLTIDFKRRLNFLTGDNGLGKSFVLDIAWWRLRAPGLAKCRLRSAGFRGVEY